MLLETLETVELIKLLDSQSIFVRIESDVCMRQCCGSSRGFTMHITNNLGQVSDVVILF
jgi:hypothetical protein